MPWGVVLFPPFTGCLLRSKFLFFNLEGELCLAWSLGGPALSDYEDLNFFVFDIGDNFLEVLSGKILLLSNSHSAWFGGLSLILLSSLSNTAVLDCLRTATF